MSEHPVVYLIVGLPGAGKTTRAKELELAESALRLTPDEVELRGAEIPPVPAGFTTWSEWASKRWPSYR